MGILRRILLLFVALVPLFPVWGQVGSRDFTSSESDYVSVSDTADLDPGTGDLSFGLWVKSSSTSRIRAMEHTDPTSGGSSEIGYYLDLIYGGEPNITDGSFLGWAGKNSSPECWRYWDTTNQWTDGGWHFVIVTYDNSANDVDIYVDGVDDTGDFGQANTETCPGNIIPTNDLGIGSTIDTDITWADEWDGQLAYAHQYHRILSVGEINTIMHCPGSITDGLAGYWPLTDSSTQYDLSDNSNDGTNSGTAASTDGPPISSNCAGAGGN